MKQNKKKKRSVKIRWSLFCAILVPTVLILVILWVLNTVLLGVFYSGIKTSELKRTTENVINNIEGDDINDRILILSNEGDINIRVIETSEFGTLYSTGEVFNSVTYGWQEFSMFNLYDEVTACGGELVRYYTEKPELPVSSEFFAENKTDGGFIDIPVDFPDNLPRNNEEMRHFRERFRPTADPGFFGHIGKHNDLLYAKIATLSDGVEVMVVADTRISPLDSTVKVLQHQLIFCSVITVLVSLVVSFVIAKHISSPIEKINKSAKVLASGDFDVRFEGQGYQEIEQLSDTLNYASSELGKVEGLRRELMANVSHDMRTPLTMIVGYSEVMRDIPGENNPENVQVIIDEAKRLTEFVNSVLDLSKLQSGMEALEMTRTDITEILEKCVERYTKLLPEESCELELECKGRAYVNCDVTKITQVLHNLVDNAVNYARDPKKVTIRQLFTGRNVRIEISDNGEGIDHDELPYIWDRYYKTDKSHKRNYVGSGIGLSIVKEILKKHSARFGVESHKDEGSTFWFELPLAE
ncbi:MAG: HAMP domain-containing histidine kinase [Clostridia bacterium]|nr:HAMP domain-containing histidine kinase [Clostridia bacterium]